MVLDASTGAPDDRPMTALRALVLQVHDAGVSYEDMAVRSRRQGFEIGKSYFNEIARGRIRLPKDERLAAVAAGLPGITESQVKEAAARSAGVHVEHNINYQTSTLLNLVNDMSPASRERWVRLATAIARELQNEESAPGRTVVVHGESKPDEHTRRVVQNVLDEVAGNLHPQKQRRQQDP